MLIAILASIAMSLPYRIDIMEETELSVSGAPKLKELLTDKSGLQMNL